MMPTDDMREGSGIGVLGPPLFVVTLLFYLVTLTPFIDLSMADAGDPRRRQVEHAEPDRLPGTDRKPLADGLQFAGTLSGRASA
jgi:hypothetical protein